MKGVFAILLVLNSFLPQMSAQIPDTTGLYGEKKDTLQATVLSASGAGNFLSRSKEIRTEVITASGLCKMACCNLAESFENSASVTVGYSDAVTGARQIRLLGQSGIYTQMLDENRPVMRGLSAPWGLNFVPSQWLESIQIAKGATSVINGVESMTGQINMEHRKPTDEKPLFLQASGMSDSRLDLNAVSSLQLNDKWSTAIFAHGDANLVAMDGNRDGFMDDPLSRNAGFGNRWLYYDYSGLQVRFGVRGIYDIRKGGQSEGVGATTRFGTDVGEGKWRADIRNRSLNAYVKVGMPLSEDQARSVALVADYTYQTLDSRYGIISDRVYNAGQHSAFANLLYQDNTNDSHHFTVGLSEMFDAYRESLASFSPAVLSVSKLNVLGAFGEYTFHSGDVFSVIAGLRGEWYNLNGFRLSPRVTLKWAPSEQFVFRANGGRGLRYSTPVIENIGMLSTSKILCGGLLEHTLEDSWTFGGNATWYLPFDSRSKTYLSLDYFRTQFTEQVILDDTSDRINLYRLSEIQGGHSYTDNVQVDFGTEPVRGLTLTLTGRYTNARQTIPGASDDIKPMQSVYKAVFNAQYATHLNKWIFDFTASLNGPCRVWDFMKDRYPGGYTQAYPLLYAQVTRRFKGIDVYVGGENLTNFKQPDPIVCASDPASTKFDASAVWGPLMGIKVYAGIRLTIWKTE